MIELVSLFLGLVVGPQPVEVSVAAEVARVEIVLGGTRCAELDGPPWIATCDFGPELRPHRLVAIAWDARENEIGRVEQRVNVPRQMAEASLALEPEIAGQPRRVRLTWRAVGHSQPSKIDVSLDGEPLLVASTEAIVLPPLDPQIIHFLRVELTFGPTLQAQAELVIGGGFGEEVTQELTAVILTGPKPPPRPERMSGWLHARGKPLRVAAVEKGDFDILVVREKSELLMGNMGDEGGLRRALVGGTPARRKTRTGAMLVAPGALALDDEASLRFVFPSTRSHTDRDGRLEVVPISLNVAGVMKGDFLTIVTDSYFPLEDIPATEQRLTDAVAIAGVGAAARGEPRAVVLITAGDTRDLSRHRPAEVRRFLDLLQVPLHVWVPLAETRSEHVAAWGEVIDISTGSGLREAIKKLKQQLDEQWVVWVEGGYLPTEIELAAKVAGFTLVGRESG